MELDDKLCLCFHVSKRKVVNFIRIKQPRTASQLSECYGAGSGCGWCRTYLQHLFEQLACEKGAIEGSNKTEEPSAIEYAALRRKYVKSGHGTPPPGATPVD